MSVLASVATAAMPQLQLQTLTDIEKSSVFRGICRILVFGGIYAILGIIIYHVTLGWDAFDSLYFLVIALSTVGYGDFVPKTEKERLFTSFFLIIGFIGFGAFISMQVFAVAQHAEHMAKQRKMRAARSMNESKSSSFLLTRIRQMSRDIFRNSTTTAKHTNALTASLNSIKEDTEDTVVSHDAFADRDSAEHHPSPASESVRGRETANMTAYLLSSYDTDIQHVRSLAFRNLFIVAIIVIVGFLSMMSIEHWTGITAFYWACQTITTVGFGDVTPTTDGGRAFAMIFVIVGCGYLASAVTDFVKYPLLVRARRHEKRLLEQFETLTEAKLHAVFRSQLFEAVPNLRRSDAELTKSEFVLLVLQMMAKVEEQDILLVASLFDRLDDGNAGTLSQAVMMEKLAEAKHRDGLNQQQAVEDSHRRPRRSSFMEVLSSVLGREECDDEHRGSQSPLHGDGRYRSDTIPSPSQGQPSSVLNAGSNALWRSAVASDLESSLLHDV